MNLEQLIEDTRSQMPARRWEHTMGVREAAVQLAHRFGADPKQADLAALLHDYCKYWPIERQREAYEAYGLPNDVLAYDPQLLHGPLAAEVAHRQYGIDDEDVLNAICYHTSGRVDMSLLEKIVCLADYIEPGRDFPGVGIIRQLAEHDLERALIAGLDSTIQFLLHKGKKVYPLTMLARNGLIEECREAQRGSLPS